MINLRDLISFLHPFYKDYDTYKDDGPLSKGILERFLNICGDYFADDIVPIIDNHTSIFDISVADKMYLNYIWEFLGSIPYAYGTLYDARLWSTFSNVAQNKEEWFKVISSLPPRAEPRNILKYAISLYKIRGSLEFYNILLGFYGYSCTIRDTTGDLNYPIPEEQVNSYQPLYDDALLYDTLGLLYDVSNNLTQSTNITLVITTGLTVTPDFKSNMYLLLNRFRPINITEFDDTNVTFI